MQALVVTGLAWIAAALVSATPFVISGISATPFQAFCDAIAYYTGTGITYIQNLSHMPVSFGLWREIMIIIGAQGIVLVAVGLGTISKFSGAGMLFEAEAHPEKIMPRLASTSRLIMLFMGAFILLGTVACSIICYAFCGFSPSRALYHGFCLATSAVTTGGISLMDVGVAYYQQPILGVVLMCLMFTGVFSFAVYLHMARNGARDFFRDIETRVILGWGFVVLVLLAAAFAQDDHFGELGAFLDRGLFNFVSAITGTGFCNLSSSQLTSVASSGVLFAYILAMGMGGATSSTSGGIKAIRIAVVFKTIVSEVRRVLLPNGAHETIRYYHLGNQLLTPELARNAMLVMVLFLLTYIAGAMIGVLHGIEPLPAVLESVSSTNNCGISAGVIGPGLPLSLQVCYMVQMLAGRLEFLALLATFMSITVSAGRGVSDSRLGRTAVSLVPARMRRAWAGKTTRRAGR